MNEMVDWTKVGNNQIKMKFIIPISNSNKKWWQFWKKSGTTAKEAEKAIADLMAKYKEDVKWDDETGEVSINGDKQIPYNKEYWFPTPNDEDVDITVTIDKDGKIQKINKNI